jgi:hypothetical protein
MDDFTYQPDALEKHQKFTLSTEQLIEMLEESSHAFNAKDLEKGEWEWVTPITLDNGKDSAISFAYFLSIAAEHLKALYDGRSTTCPTS